jgi:hypothetical protein
VLAGQRIQRVPAVADGADHTRDPVGDAGMRPDLAGIDGVGFCEFDGVHLGTRRGPGNA